jgi:phosphoglucomutase
MDPNQAHQLLAAAEAGVTQFLESARARGDIDQQAFQQASQNVVPNLRKWLTDDEIPRFSPNFRQGVYAAIQAQRWEDIVNAYRQQARFGTGGIRGMMAFDRASVEQLAKEGSHAPILKGPNTINDVVLLLTSAGVAKFGKEQKPAFDRVVIGYDSRVRGQDLGKLVAQLFLHYGYTVYFFDEPCPYPEMTFAIPYKEIQGDIGILISASHNDYRYNGYKLSCSNGSQFDPEQRDEMYKKYIAKATTRDIGLMKFEDAPADKLVFLGGDERIEGFNYLGREGRVVNVHQAHADHVKSFLLTPDLKQRETKAKKPLCIAYCAFHGAGRRAVPRLLRDVGFRDLRIITSGGLNDLNGLFPSFEWRAGREQQPDPGDVRAALTAVKAYREDHQAGRIGSFDDVDILIGTDPDADRCGVVVKVPESQRSLYDGQDWTLLSADSLWALLLWYRMHREIERHGIVKDSDRKFIVLSHTTSDSIVLLARKYGLGVIKTWVGFAALAASVRDVWERKELKHLKEGRVDPNAELCDPFVCEYQDMHNGRRSINVAAMEQSNGYSILGGRPPDARSLGVGGHVRDKDGTLAALLVAEIAAWAKDKGTTLFELIDKHIYLDPAVGLFVNHYEPDPLDGEYPGIQGDQKKKEILRRTLGYLQFALAGDFQIGGRKATSTAVYRTGKYDAIYPATSDFRFPDEGVRFYLGDEFNHVTVRPSGTGNSLRFHIQLRDPDPSADLVTAKQKLTTDAVAIADELREILKAPRS